MWGRRKLDMVNLCRLIHQTRASMSSAKGNLSKLRKKTGFSFINCKKALEKFENDIDKAEVWLKEQAQKEGWSKATKLSGRATAQGLIGLVCQEHCATMVEVNCETDFVARNSKFQHFVGQAASSTLTECKRLYQSHDKVIKVNLTEDDLKKIPLVSDSSSLGENLVTTIGQIGENMTLRRAVYLSAPSENIIGSYVHSALSNPKTDQSAKYLLGKYAALVLFRRTGDVESSLPSRDMGRRLSQHVVGMNPLRIGEYTPPSTEELAARQEQGKGSTETEGQEMGEEEETTTGEAVEDAMEEEMLNQEYLLDPNLKVGDFLLEERAEVLDFVRYECGENLEG